MNIMPSNISSYPGQLQCDDLVNFESMIKLVLFYVRPRYLVF